MQPWTTWDEGHERLRVSDYGDPAPAARTPRSRTHPSDLECAPPVTHSAHALNSANSHLIAQFDMIEYLLEINRRKLPLGPGYHPLHRIDCSNMTSNMSW